MRIKQIRYLDISLRLQPTAYRLSYGIKSDDVLRKLRGSCIPAQPRHRVIIKLLNLGAMHRAAAHQLLRR